jgi:myo-inositol 2-dehydrogenase/D-chiro-inositol 1-dehydrogenase
VRTQAKELGVAIIGGGRVGLFRGEVANRHPAVRWIGLAEKNPNRAGEVAPKVGADFVTQSHVELLRRPRNDSAASGSPARRRCAPARSGM